MRQSASTSSVLACIASNAPRGLLSALLDGSCILGGLALLLLVFSQTTPTNDAFFNQTGLECFGVVGPELGLLLGWSAGSGSSDRR